MFTDKEWNELTKNRIGVPSIPHDIVTELAKYESETLKKLHAKAMKLYLNEGERYTVSAYYNKEWIQIATRSLCNLYENADRRVVWHMH